jgi:tRNA(Ile)-lysidine synthase
VSDRALLSPGTDHPVERAVRQAARRTRLLLAVSGGRDSMALLHAAARACPGSVAMVATFDHGTGAAATRAARLVATESAALGFPCVIGMPGHVGTTEAEWRAQRLEFLDDVARRVHARVATAHTRDDQIETVVMRVMRDAGARGLAGLYSVGERVRPFLELSRVEVTAYARAVRAAWVDDPTNISTRYLRNRVRRDLLPAIRRAAPAFETQVLAIARNAAMWRRRLDRAVSAAIRVDARRDGIVVAAADLAGFSPKALAVLWPAIAARAGVVSDWRGTRRAVAFMSRGRVGARVQLSDGWTLSRSREAFELRREHDVLAEATLAPPGLDWGTWVFRSLRRVPAGADAWVARLPADRPMTVRAWRPGDRMETRHAAAPRRVKRLLSDAGITGFLRARWPVVLAGERIVWIPGVRCSPGAAVRPEASGVLFACDFRDR